jgi:hypothetical protein
LVDLWSHACIVGKTSSSGTVKIMLCTVWQFYIFAYRCDLPVKFSGIALFMHRSISAVIEKFLLCHI